MTGSSAAHGLALAAVLVLPPPGQAVGQELPARYVVAGDSIALPLGGKTGDPGRGRALVMNRHIGLCLLCHSGPFPEERFQGTIAPDLGGAGTRLSEGQIRLRIVDPGRVNASTIMPAYYRTGGLTRVGAAYRGKPVLNAQQIEDIVAFIATLRDTR